MSGQNDRLLVLEVGLFPDQETLGDALALIAADRDVLRHDLTRQSMTDQSWDRVVDDILSARKVVTI